MIITSGTFLARLWRDEGSNLTWPAQAPLIQLERNVGARNAGDELADVLMSRYEKFSTMLTSNRPIEDWSKLLGDVVVVAPLLDRLMHRGNLLKFEGRSWRLKEAAERVAKRAVNA